MPKLIGAETQGTGNADSGGEQGMTESTITVDQIVELLNSMRRRNVLGCMESLAGKEAEWDELVRCVTAAEAGEDWSEQERKRVQISLHQNHIPALERAGVVVERKSEEGERYVTGGPHYGVVKRAHKALHEAATNEDGGDSILGRFF